MRNISNPQWHDGNANINTLLRRSVMLLQQRVSEMMFDNSIIQGWLWYCFGWILFPFNSVWHLKTWIFKSNCFSWRSSLSHCDCRETQAIRWSLWRIERRFSTRLCVSQQGIDYFWARTMPCYHLNFHRVLIRRHKIPATCSLSVNTCRDATKSIQNHSQWEERVSNFPLVFSVQL